MLRQATWLRLFHLAIPEVEGLESSDQSELKLSIADKDHQNSDCTGGSCEIGLPIYFAGMLDILSSCIRPKNKKKKIRAINNYYIILKKENRVIMDLLF